MSEPKLRRSVGRTCFAMAAIAVPLTLGCSVEKEREGDMPDVDVDVSEGRVPDYDVDVDLPDVDVGTERRTVTVPKIRVEMDETEIEVPYIDLDPDDPDAPAGRTAAAATGDQTLTVELEVPEDRYDVSIEEIYLADDELIVVSRLVEDPTQRAPGAPADKNASDTVVIHAADADRLETTHYVIGQRVGSDPAYRFIGDRSEIEAELRGALRVYRAEIGASDRRVSKL